MKNPGHTYVVNLVHVMFAMGCLLQLLNVCYVHLIYLPPDVLLQGMDLYFQRHDGQAVTCEDFYAAMCDANNAQLPNFLQWYTYSQGVIFI